MNEILHELENVKNTEESICIIVKYLAYCYVNNMTSIANIINCNSKVYNCSYNYILHRLEDYITRKYKVNIDQVTLMSYLDYYFEHN
jgi:hypothetical protein